MKKFRGCDLEHLWPYWFYSSKDLNVSMIIILPDINWQFASFLCQIAQPVYQFLVFVESDHELHGCLHPAFRMSPAAHEVIDVIQALRCLVQLLPASLRHHFYRAAAAQPPQKSADFTGV